MCCYELVIVLCPCPFVLCIPTARCCNKTPHGIVIDEKIQAVHAQAQSNLQNEESLKHPLYAFIAVNPCKGPWSHMTRARHATTVGRQAATKARSAYWKVSGIPSKSSKSCRHVNKGKQRKHQPSCGCFKIQSWDVYVCP